MLSFIKLFLMFLLVVVVCVTLKCQLKGGMALYQDSKRLDKDKNKCTFNSIIHAFKANVELNRLVCKVLKERIRKGEYRWRELLKILCNSEYTQKITCTTQQYLPIDVFGDSLQHSLTRMKQSGLPKETYGSHIDTDISKDPRMGGWTELYIHELIPYLLDSQYTGPYNPNVTTSTLIHMGYDILANSTDVPLDINYYKIQKIGNKHTLNSWNVVVSYFFYAHINFEAAFMGVQGHVATITKTNSIRNLYTYYDDYLHFDFKPHTNKPRDILLINFLINQIRGSRLPLTDLVVITNSIDMPDDRMYLNKYILAEVWTNFFSKLDLHQIIFSHNPGKLKRREPLSNHLPIVEKLALLIADMYRQFIAKMTNLNIPPIDELKRMRSKELWILCKDLGITEAELDYLREKEDIIAWIELKMWKSNYNGIPIDELKRMRLKELRRLGKDLGITEAELDVMEEREDFIAWIELKTWKSNYNGPSSKIPPSYVLDRMTPQVLEILCRDLNITTFKSSSDRKEVLINLLEEKRATLELPDLEGTMIKIKKIAESYNYDISGTFKYKDIIVIPENDPFGYRHFTKPELDILIKKLGISEHILTEMLISKLDSIYRDGLAGFPDQLGVNRLYSDSYVHNYPHYDPHYDPDEDSDVNTPPFPDQLGVNRLYSDSYVYNSPHYDPHYDPDEDSDVNTPPGPAKG